MVEFKTERLIMRQLQWSPASKKAAPAGKGRVVICQVLGNLEMGCGSQGNRGIRNSKYQGFWDRELVHSKGPLPKTENMGGLYFILFFCQEIRVWVDELFLTHVKFEMSARYQQSRYT